MQVRVTATAVGILTMPGEIHLQCEVRCVVPTACFLSSLLCLGAIRADLEMCRGFDSVPKIRKKKRKRGSGPSWRKEK